MKDMIPMIIYDGQKNQALHLHKIQSFFDLLQ